MQIHELVNEYARPYSPYMGNFVNHLPMGQLALYQMNRKLEDIKSYSDYYVNHFNIDLAKTNYPKVHSIEECLGKRDLYESCLDAVRESIEAEGMDKVIRRILNHYSYGLSSGLFHTSIRLFYAVEGFKVDHGLKEEVARALAYYVTGYKEAKKFRNKIEGPEFKDQIKNLIQDLYINNLTESKSSMGQKMNALYHDSKYLDKGFVIAGDEEEKIRTLLGLTLPMHDHYQNIIILHCTTGLHALIGLKDYFDDFSEILDIMSTCIITHLLTIDGLEVQDISPESPEKKWEDVIALGCNSKNVHTIKYTYTCSKLDKLYALPTLKKSAIRKITSE
ncbi:DUF4243 domain-containing protein [Alkalibacter rhizosphaerae]|uniref:DUF4243 domain-containing protein n=1 Tax=Alkalibacter rhizosphaerae TaxID=2815577 RepID=A0A974XIT0_9FIRM|nr:questin oxidase family protein [Alkalibacter rhizosphaerae]QSX09485.1 DUF4243 domain-containing protein [Alkalibacter rhizosphaerae]